MFNFLKRKHSLDATKLIFFRYAKILISVSPTRQGIGKMKIAHVMCISMLKSSHCCGRPAISHPVFLSSSEMFCTWTRNFFTNIICFISELWFLWLILETVC